MPAVCTLHSLAPVNHCMQHLLRLSQAHTPAETHPLQLDRQEALLREEQRAALAAKAQAAIWQQTDVARAVRAQLLLSEVMSEREQQVAERQHVRILEQLQENRHYANLLSQVEVRVLHTAYQTTFG